MNDRISREDMAVLIYRVLKLLGTTTIAVGDANGKTSGFLDLEETAAYARDAVSALQKGGLLNGMTEGYFDPKGSSTRAQAAAVIYRMYQVIQ